MTSVDADLRNGRRLETGRRSESIIQMYIYIYLNQTVLELDFRAVKFLFFPRRDLNPHH